MSDVMIHARQVLPPKGEIQSINELVKYFVQYNLILSRLFYACAYPKTHTNTHKNQRDYFKVSLDSVSMNLYVLVLCLFDRDNDH
jgi:hypothetical protein